jgi:hypothetical protein
MHVVVILNAMVSTSDSTTAAQPNRYSALPNTEGVQGQRGVGKGVAPSQFLVSIHCSDPETYRFRNGP